jgi:hypothetical protein
MSVPEYVREWEGKRVEIEQAINSDVAYRPSRKRGLVVAVNMANEGDERVIYARVVRDDGFLEIVSTGRLTKLVEDPSHV